MAKTDARYGKCQFSKICLHDKTNKAIQEDGATRSLLAGWLGVCVAVGETLKRLYLVLANCHSVGISIICQIWASGTYLREFKFSLIAKNDSFIVLSWNISLNMQLGRKRVKRLIFQEALLKHNILTVFLEPQAPRRSQFFR